MQNKNFKILLLLGVLIVWGLICFKIYNHFFDSDSDFGLMQNSISNQPKKKSNKLDTLYLNYRDPFLVTTNYRPEKKKERSYSKQDESKIESTIPKIIYKGSINSSSKLLIILSVNGVEKIYPLNSEIDGIKVLSTVNNSVKIKYFNKTLILEKS